MDQQPTPSIPPQDQQPVSPGIAASPNTPIDSPLPTVPAPLMPERKPPLKKLVIIMAGLVLLAVLAGLTFMLMRQPQQSATKDAHSSKPLTQVSLQNLESAYEGFAKNGVKEFSADKKQATLDAFKELNAGFTISEQFYSDEANILIGLGIARLSLDDPSSKDIFKNQLYLLTWPYMPAVPRGITDEYFQKNDDQANKASEAILNEYSDAGLSKRVQDTINNSGIAKEVAEQLKLKSPADLADYTVIATDFDNGTPRQQEFAKKHYMFGATPKMWVESIGDQPYLVMVKNYAQDFVNNPHGSARHSVVHEFIHVQNAFVRGDLGRSVEERRAELFSGNKSAYYDAKQFFIYVQVFSGVDIIKLLEQYPTRPAAFYTQLYAALGLKAGNTFVATWPNVYLGSPSSAVRKVNDGLGGYDAVIKQLQKTNANQAGLDQRLKDRAERLFSVFKSKQAMLDDLSYNLGQTYAMPSAASAMKTYVEDNY